MEYPNDPYDGIIAPGTARSQPLFNANDLKTPILSEDMVNHPPHYTKGGIETIDYMEAKATPEEFKGHLRLTALKYLSRAGDKDDILQEYEKAAWYINKLIETIKKERGIGF